MRVTRSILNVRNFSSWNGNSYVITKVKLIAPQMKPLLKLKTSKSVHTTPKQVLVACRQWHRPTGGSTTGCHGLQAVAPPQPAVQPPAILPLLNQARVGGGTDPNLLPSPLYTTKASPPSFLPNTPHFKAKDQQSLFLLRISLKVFSKNPLNSIFESFTLAHYYLLK